MAILSPTARTNYRDHNQHTPLSPSPPILSVFTLDSDANACYGNVSAQLKRVPPLLSIGVGSVNSCTPNTAACHLGTPPNPLLSHRQLDYDNSSLLEGTGGGRPANDHAPSDSTVSPFVVDDERTGEDATKANEGLMETPGVHSGGFLASFASRFYT